MTTSALTTIDVGFLAAYDGSLSWSEYSAVADMMWMVFYYHGKVVVEYTCKSEYYDIEIKNMVMV